MFLPSSLLQGKDPSCKYVVAAPDHGTTTFVVLQKPHHASFHLPKESVIAVETAQKIPFSSGITFSCSIYLQSLLDLARKRYGIRFLEDCQAT